MNPERSKENHSTKESYLGQDLYLPASNGFVAMSLVMALILNFLPLPGDILTLRPDFVALTIAYWNVNHPHKMGMSAAFSLGLLMDVGHAGILGQYALAYCVVVYLTFVLRRRLRLFSLLQQAPQIGFILFIMQLVIVLIAIASGSALPEWQYYLASVTGALLWAPGSFLLIRLLKPKPDPDTL